MGTALFGQEASSSTTKLFIISQDGIPKYEAEYETVSSHYLV